MAIQVEYLRGCFTANNIALGARLIFLTFCLSLHNNTIYPLHTHSIGITHITLHREVSILPATEIPQMDGIRGGSLINVTTVGCRFNILSGNNNVSTVLGSICPCFICTFCTFITGPFIPVFIRSQSGYFILNIFRHKNGERRYIIYCGRNSISARIVIFTSIILRSQIISVHRNNRTLRCYRIQIIVFRSKCTTSPCSLISIICMNIKCYLSHRPYNLNNTCRSSATIAISSYCNIIRFSSHQRNTWNQR